MSSSSFVPVPTTTTVPATSVTSSVTGPELMDAKGSCVDSPIPTNPNVNTSLDIHLHSTSSPAISHNAYPIPALLEHGAQQHRSDPEDLSVIQKSLDNLKLGKDHTAFDSEGSLRNGALDLYTTIRETSMNVSENPTELVTSTAASQQEGSTAIRLMSRNSDTGSYEQSSVISDGADSSPVIVVSSQSRSPEPFADQLKPGLPIFIDEPDERLLNALETPRDRLFVIKLEKDVIGFIQENTCEIFDLPPINAYHRLLAHKMAEYYRLTHVADATGASVRYYRGQYARIPPVRLADKGTLLQNPTNPTGNGTAPTMKIMQRRSRSEKGTDTPPDHSDTAPKKPSSETSSGDGSSRTTSREEREAAYERARARIFKDFVSSPPETPPPTRSNDKQRKPAQPDDFSGRSQFFPVLASPASQHYYPPYENPVPQFQNTHMPVVPRFNPNTPSFNPNTPSFNPNGSFVPQPFMNPMPNWQFQPPVDRSFPSVGQSQMPSIYPQQHQVPQYQHPLQHQALQHHQHPQHPQHQQRQQHQQQLRNGFYDQTTTFSNSHPQQQQQHASTLTPSFPNTSRFIPQQHPHPQPQHQHQQPAHPPPASGNRHPYTSPSNYAVTSANNMPPQRFPQPYNPGWSTPQTSGHNGIGGAPMGATRSQPAMSSFDRYSPPFGGMPYQNHHNQHQQQHHPQQQWAGSGGQAAANGFGRGGTMHGPVGGM